MFLELVAVGQASFPLELVQQNPARFVSWIRIIEREERADRRYAEMVEAASPHRDFSQYKRPKNLKAKFFEKLQSAIEMRCDEMLFVKPPSVARFLAGFQTFFVSDLETAKNDLPPRMPESYDIFNFFLDQYHSRLCNLLDRLQKNDGIMPDEIMTLLRWAPKYKSMMSHSIGVDVTTRFEQQASRDSPLATDPLVTENLPENADGVLRPPSSVLSGRYPAAFLIFADARYVDAVIAAAQQRR